MREIVSLYSPNIALHDTIFTRLKIPNYPSF